MVRVNKTVSDKMVIVNFRSSFSKTLICIQPTFFFEQFNIDTKINHRTDQEHDGQQMGWFCQAQNQL
jgi:hypothetical protein